MLLCLSMLLNSVSNLSYAMENFNNEMFKDVSPSDWFYESVKESVENNIFSGTGKDTFSPNDFLTRAMYVTIIGRIAQVDNNHSLHNAYFTDLDTDAYYVPYVIWAVEKGITQGIGNNQFSPNSIITREQLATFTVRYFDAYGISYSESTVSTLPKDLNEISPWAQEAVLKLWKSGLFKGDDKGNFNPQSKATRSEAAVFSVRINEKVKQSNTNLGEIKVPIQNIDRNTAKYYLLSFNSNGGSSTESFSRREGGNLSNLPVPYKEGAVFAGWYYDKELTKLVGSNDVVRENLTLYAKWVDAVPLAEDETKRFASAIDQNKNFSITIKGLESMTADEVENLISVKNFNSQDDKDWIKITKSGSDFIVSGLNYSGQGGTKQNGFEEGVSYKLTLNDERLMFDGFPQETRDFSFTIKKEDVFNLSLNEKMDFIKFEDISNIEENGSTVNSIKTTPMKVTENGSGAGDMVEGTFTYNGQGSFDVGDTVSIYEGIHPNERVLDDTREGSDGNISYIEITSVSGTTYGYKNADVEDVLFTPDVLPVSVDADTDGNVNNNSITVEKAVMDYSDDIYAAVGLDSQTTVDKGDYISFYDGDLNGSSSPKQEGFALITEVTVNSDSYIIVYKEVTLNELIAAMDMYNTDSIDGDDMLKGVDIAAVEAQIEQQAVDSGFAEDAGYYLAAMALETESFTKITEDFELRNYQILNESGEPLSPDDVRLMDDGGMSVKVEVSPPKASISTNLEHFEDTSGLRLTLKIEAKITIGPKTPEDGDGQVVITLTGEFEEEVHVGINVDGGARWEWWAIFPYIAEYEVTANIDLFNYTGLKFNASIVTKEYSDDKWTEDEDLSNVVDELKTLVDEVKEGLGSEEEDDPANDLIAKYKAMMETESDWVTLVEKEIYEYSYRIPPIMIIEIKMEIKFVVQANMNISLGAEFWYKTAKRYTYNVEVFAKNVTSDVLDLVEEQYEFTFYVMGTLGLRAGISIEAKICLFDEKFASVGFSAEAGAYIKMYGYFYYQLTYKASTGRESKYSGALYFELGIYLEIAFEAQAFAGTFSYNPTLYENEWPLWSAGMRENIQDFAYSKDEAPEISMKKSIKTTFVPDSVFEMLYLDLKTGDDGTMIYDDSEQYFTIEMTNDKFSYDRATNSMTITPAEKDIQLDGQMVISWINQPLAWTSKPISMRINLHWDNLNDGYAIVFHSNGGSSIPIIIKRYGEVILSPADPVKKGYIFDGWYSDKGFTQKYTIPETMPNVDMEVYAKWTPATDTPYKIEHYGELLGSSQYELLETVALKGTTDSTVFAATKDYMGYITPASRQITISPDGSSILRYYYDREIYTLTFKPGEAQGENLVSHLKYGAKITAPSFISKGYSFTGWDFEFPADGKMPAEDLTYTAQWTPSDDTPYRVEYYVEQVNGKYTLQRLDDSKTGTTGSNVAIESIFDPTYLIDNGITYKDTTVNGEATTTPKITKDGKLIIKVNYKRESNDAIFNPDNGEENTIISVKYQGIITAPTQNPAKQGYVFDKWEGYTIGDTMGTADINYTAKWNPATDTAYTVKHIREDLSGNYPSSGNLVETETKIGTTDAQTEAQAKTYQGFTPGTVTQTKVLPDATVAVEIKYSRNSYTVNWIANEQVHKTEQVKYGTTITKPTSNPTKQGYEFASWDGFAAGATMGITEQNFTATWNPATDTDYTVKHIREDLNDNYLIEELETKKGTTETRTSASPKIYQGFTADTSYDQVEIKPDGSTVVTILYNRNSYDITWIANGDTYKTDNDVKYDSAIVKPSGMPDNKTGYTFDLWIDVPDTMPAQDSSYEASWTANTYIVTFDGKGGATSGSAITVTYDSTYGSLPTPTRPGYNFVNWTLRSDATITASSTVRTAYDHELIASWAAETDVKYTVEHYKQNVVGGGYTLVESSTMYGETDTDTKVVANSYEGFDVQELNQENIAGDGSTVVCIYYNRNIHTVTWDINGTEVIENYRYGATVSQPSATRTGYNFVGWNMSVESTMPDRDLSYTATWTPKQYKVSFDSNGGSIHSYITVTYDSTYGNLPTPTRTGYEFDGWFTSENGGTKVEARTNVEITSAQTLYAQWTARNYTVSFNLNTGTGTAPKVITVTYDGTYTSLPENSGSKTGYTFTGWYNAANGGSNISKESIVNTASNHTLYAQWQANTYQVVFDANGGSGTMVNQSYTYDESQSLSANGFEKTGHSFSGWNTMSNGNGTSYEDTEEVTNLATEGSITLYAKWTVKQYTISFDSNGGSAVSPITQDYDTAVTVPAVPTKIGYTFGFWQKNGVDYSFSTMPAENITLTAKWNTVDYDITYVLNGGTNFIANPLNYNIESGNITLGDASGKAGYTFDGWYTDAIFTNKVGSIAIAQGSTGAKTFYAKWEPNTYTVIFHKNIGDGITVSQSYSYDDAAKALTANSFVRNGYSFYRWYTNSDGTGTEYYDKQTVQNLTTTEDGIFNLYAKWNAETYNIQYELNGGTQATVQITSYTVQSNDITLMEPTRGNGYGFMGWYDNANFTGSKVETITRGSTGDKTLYAKWGFAGTFTVTNNNNSTFTITRSGNGTQDAQNVGQQTVYFRTINGSAIGGTHFVHQGGTIAAVTFADAETVKTVTVTEYGVTSAYNGITATSYSNIDRTYQLELVSVVGGGLLGSNKVATRTMTKDSNYVVASDVYNYKSFATHSKDIQIFENSGGSYSATVYTGLAGSPLTGRGVTANIQSYLRETSTAMKVRLDISGEDDGWRMVRYVFFNNHTNNTATGKNYDVSVATPDSNYNSPSITLPAGTKAGLIYGLKYDKNNSASYTLSLPANNGQITPISNETLPSDGGGLSVFAGTYTSESSSQYVSYGFDETVGISVSTYNKADYNSSYWYQGGTLYSAPLDTNEPIIKGIAPMATGDYKAGETVKIAVVFNEIVANVNSATISGTNLNTMTYAGGVNTNVLYFTGTVKTDSNQDTILTGITLSGTVLDMAN